MTDPKRFALIGVGGFVAPRHLQAIHATGNRLVAACDPNDSVGILDSYSFDVRYFQEIERFDRFLEKSRRKSTEKVDWVSICSPNYLHDAHARLAMRVDSDVLCEKPLVINPWNLDALAEIEEETGRRVFTVLQLRTHPVLISLRQSLREEETSSRRNVVLNYVTSRGPWYGISWKGSEERSGGVMANIGIHFFDLLIWLFGSVRGREVHLREQWRAAGSLELEHADVQWFLSVDSRDLPFEPTPGGNATWRSITVDGEEVEFTRGFTDLHTRVYEMTLSGRGFGLEDARPSIELVHQLRTDPVSSSKGKLESSLPNAGAGSSRRRNETRKL